MYGRFSDTKQAYIIDMLNALHDYDLNCGVLFIAYKQYAAMREVHEYIRTMRTGFTVQRNDEYSRLKKTMRLFRGSGGKADRATIQKIAQAIDIKVCRISGVSSVIRVYFLARDMNLSTLLADSVSCRISSSSSGSRRSSAFCSSV